MGPVNVDVEAYKRAQSMLTCGVLALVMVRIPVAIPVTDFISHQIVPGLNLYADSKLNYCIFMKSNSAIIALFNNET